MKVQLAQWLTRHLTILVARPATCKNNFYSAKRPRCFNTDSSRFGLQCGRPQPEKRFHRVFAAPLEIHYSVV